MFVSIARAQDFFLVLTRTLAILSAVPVLGGRAIPARVRLGLGILLAAVIFPWPSGLPQTDSVQPLMPFLWDIARELITGILAGMAIRLAFAALETAASLMSLGVGFSAGAVLNPAFDSSSTAFDQFYTLTAVLIFLVTNGHHQVLRGLARAFEAVPLRSLTLTTAGQAELMQMAAGMLVSAAQIALPVVSVMLLVDMAMGLVARVAPQMNVFFLGAPVKVGVGLLVLSLALPLLIPAMTTLFDGMVAKTIRLIH